ncbi:peroxisomal targeting signal 2 receptor [Nowakowskiella sp. JEL0078]|nr:peroxisomal targeting signal 2 receptor [Nowakowskiella sp. JEL0078]
MSTKFRTIGFNGYAVEFSPFFEYKLACASASNYGIVGNGKLWILNVGPQGIVVETTYDSQDGLFDCAWNEYHENQLVTSSGDGSIKLWDVTLPNISLSKNFPVRNWQEHQREVFSVKWNLVRKDTFVSGSWDHTIKLWSPEAPQSLHTWQEHTHCIYSTVWSPTNPDVFASASGDHTIKLWDTRQSRSVQTIAAHTNEVLALDWNKYRENTVVTGSVDQSIKVFDWRFPAHELRCFLGHEYAVRRLKCSPHDANVVASVSYDMSVKVWDLAASEQSQGLMMSYGEHTEFVLGLDFSLHIPGQVATCAWDESVHLFKVPVNAVV